MSQLDGHGSSANNACSRPWSSSRRQDSHRSLRWSFPRAQSQEFGSLRDAWYYHCMSSPSLSSSCRTSLTPPSSRTRRTMVISQLPTATLHTRMAQPEIRPASNAAVYNSFLHTQEILRHRATHQLATLSDPTSQSWCQEFHRSRSRIKTLSQFCKHSMASALRE